MKKAVKLDEKEGVDKRRTKKGKKWSAVEQAMRGKGGIGGGGVEDEGGLQWKRGGVRRKVNLSIYQVGKWGAADFRPSRLCITV